VPHKEPVLISLQLPCSVEGAWVQNRPSATHAADLWDRISGPLAAVVWCLPTMALAYAVMFATFVLGFIMIGRVELPSPPPDLALPAIPKWLYAVLIPIGPCALAGGVVLALSRWWVGMVGGVGLGALSGAVLYLSADRRPEAPVFTPIAWVLVGCVGAWRREIASRTISARAEPGAAPNRF
jgi:hypothetical protein